jgi:hypothetical protein
MERIAYRTIGNLQKKVRKTRINTRESVPIGTNLQFGTGNAA